VIPVTLVGLAWAWWTIDRTPELPRIGKLGGPSDGYIMTLAFSPDGRTLASGGQRLLLHDLATGTARRLRPPPVSRDENDEPEEAVMLTLTMAFSPDGTLLATGDFHGVVRIWDIAGATLRSEFPGHQGRRVLSVDFAPDGRTVASAGDDRAIRLWNLEEAREERAFTVPRHDIPWNLPRPTGCVVGFQPDGETLSYAEYRTSSALLLWERSSGGHRFVRDGLDSLWPYQLSPDARSMIAGDPSSVAVWDIPSGRPILRLTGPHARSWAGTGSAFSGDGRLLAISWVSPTQTWLDHLSEPERNLLAQAGIETGHRRDIAVHDAATGRMLRRLPGQTVAAFSPDGRRLATSDGSSGVVLWDLRIRRAARWRS
jgi:WD40 repeat protein